MTDNPIPTRAPEAIFPIPQSAVDAVYASAQAFAAAGMCVDDEQIARIASPILAAEFRRFADIVPVGPARTILLNHADELDGGT